MSETPPLEAGPGALAVRTAIDSRLDAAERDGDVAEFIRVLQTLAVEERAPQLSRLVALVAKFPRIQWSLWLEHARNTLGWKVPASLAHAELSKLALMHEVFTPLVAIPDSELTPASLETALRDVVAAALKQPPDGTSMHQWLVFLRREASRRVCAQALDRVVAAQLDAVVAGAFDQAAKEIVSSTSTASGQGEKIRLINPEPCSEPVDGHALLSALVAAVRRFVVQSNISTDAVALYAVLAYVYDSFDILPILVFTSPVKRCGKTRLLHIMRALMPRSLFTANITVAALFRTISASRPSLLVDEADTFIKLSDELRGVLNSGHARDTAYVTRSVGDDHEPRNFPTWCPKVIALIGKLPDTLEDRSILIPMKRRTRGEPIERLRLGRLSRELEPLRRQAARWAVDHEAELREADPALPEELDDRAADNWRPLIAIADLVGGPWPQRAREAALALSGDPNAEADEAAALMMLSDLRDIFRAVEELPTELVLQALLCLSERPWPDWNRGRPLTPRQLAKLVKPFGVRPKQLTRPVNAKGYRAVDLREAFTRYLPPLNTPGHGSEAVDPKYPKSALQNDHLASSPDPKRAPAASDAGRHVTAREDAHTSDTSASSPQAPASTSVPSAP